MRLVGAVGLAVDGQEGEKEGSALPLASHHLSRERKDTGTDANAEKKPASRVNGAVPLGFGVVHSRV